MNLWKATTAVLSVTLVATLGVTELRVARAEQQPHMVNALKDLRSAKQSLKSATADKGGFRVKAIALVDQAIDEVQKGIDFDNKH